MADTTKIEWADSTFNPWIGCTKVSPACDHCYAAGMMETRYGRVEWGGPGKGVGTRRRTSPGNWKKPLQWQRQAETFHAGHGRKRRVFCASLADVFDNAVAPEWRDDLWQLIRQTPDLIWMMLTKRPQNIAGMLPPFWDEVKGHVWLGTTVEDQTRADQNIPHLLPHDAAVRFVSCEPLLGAIDLMDIPWPADRPRFPETEDISDGRSALHLIEGAQIDWVICGGESGPGARPMHPDWARSLRDQCAAAGVPFLFKQWGNWSPVSHREDLPGRPQMVRAGDCFVTPDGQSHVLDDDLSSPLEGEDSAAMRHVGKHRAGRLLDGVEHNGFPGRKD